jgi:hypothetical protein
MIKDTYQNKKLKKKSNVSFTLDFGNEEMRKARSLLCAANTRDSKKGNTAVKRVSLRERQFNTSVRRFNRF